MKTVRLLVLYQALDAARDQPGYYDGFERLVADRKLRAHHAIPFQARVEERGWPALWHEAYAAARAMEADAVFLQFFHCPGWIMSTDPSQGIKHLKRLPSAPIVFTSLGDSFGVWIRTIPSCYRIASRLADVNFLTGMGYLARHLARQGARNLVLMPNGLCQVRFSGELDQSDYAPEFDVAFIGSNNTYSKNVLSQFFWTTRRRRKLVELFTKRYGRRFGLFGNGWMGNPSWQGPIHYDRQHNAYHHSAIALGGIPGGYHDYYTSDRVFIAVASSIPFVDYAVRGVDLLLRPGEDWWPAPNISAMVRWCDYLLSLSEQDRLQIGARAREHVLRFHTQYHRCREMVDIVQQLRAARSAGVRAMKPELTFLNAGHTSPFDPPAVMAWQG